MMQSQTMELRASVIREKLNALSGTETLTDDQRAEVDTLSTEYRDVETKRRAAIVAEDLEAVASSEAVANGDEVVDTETRERRELRGKARVGDYIRSVVTGRPITGASGEYADAIGCAGYLPMDLLDPRDTETRAVTSGPASETVTSTRPTVPYAFLRTDTAALGIAMPQVSPGEAHFPALSTSPPASPKAKDAAADSTAAAFTLTKRTPGRITGAFEIRIEDLALMPSMESDLRTAISAKLAESLDTQVISGSGGAPNLSGLFKQATDVAAATATETFATGVARFAALVDGNHANGWGDIRGLIGTDTFAMFAGLFQSNGDMSLFDYLAGKLGMLRVSTRVPAKDTNAQKGLVIRSAQAQSIVVPVWTGIEITVDPYTQAGKGRRIVTATTLVGSPFIPYGTAQVVEVHPKIS